MGARGRSGDDTQRRVWEAAVRLFAAQGFHGTGIRELAEGAGLTSATLYHYMGTKEDLLFSVMRTCLDRLIRAAERVAGEGAGPEAVITRLVHVHVLTHALHRDETTVVDNEIGALAPGHRDEMVRLRDRYEEFWRDAIADGCDRGAFSVPDRRLARMAALEMCSGVAKWYSPSGPLDLGAVSAAHAVLVLQMLGAPAGEAAPAPDASGIRALVEEIWQIRLPSLRARPPHPG
ncbi:TetR family transcriptional regulator [Nocardiopsis sp. CNT-189]|uniref:TetR/AcrR family transcriptional regulator n=1 Tax=Nocardiopsis oceanisediminis TaxID=2816862 RepID=UPI003B359C73